jgi:hypothetical protein
MFLGVFGVNVGVLYIEFFRNMLNEALKYSNNNNSNEYFLPGDKKKSRLIHEIEKSKLIEENTKHNPADNIYYLNPKKHEEHGPSHQKSKFTRTTSQHEKVLAQIKSLESKKEAKKLMNQNPFVRLHEEHAKLSGKHPVKNIKGGKKSKKSNKKQKKSNKKQRKTRKH